MVIFMLRACTTLSTVENSGFPSPDGSLFEALIGPLVRNANISEDERLRRVDKIVDFCIRGVTGN